MTLQQKQVSFHTFWSLSLSHISLILWGSRFVVHELPISYNGTSWICWHVIESHPKIATVRMHSAGNCIQGRQLGWVFCSFVSRELEAAWGRWHLHIISGIHKYTKSGLTSSWTIIPSDQALSGLIDSSSPRSQSIVFSRHVKLMNLMDLCFAAFAIQRFTKPA